MAVGADAQRSSFRLGRFEVENLNQNERIRGETARRAKDQSGIAHLWEVRTGEWSLALGYQVWENGHRDLSVFDRGDVPQRFDRLRDSARLSIYEEGRWRWTELDIVMLKPGGKPDTYRATSDDLDHACAENVAAALRRLGASAFGTRQQLLGERNKRRFRLCTTFAPDELSVPIAAYVATRIAAVDAEIQAPAEKRCLPQESECAASFDIRSLRDRLADLKVAIDELGELERRNGSPVREHLGEPDVECEVRDDVVSSRREFERASRAADKAARTARAYWAYVVELDDQVGTRDGSRPWVYVGQSARTPETRFQQHRDGYKASRWVKNYGRFLRPDLYEDQPVLRTREEAERYEEYLAAQLRLDGYSVRGGH